MSSSDRRRALEWQTPTRDDLDGAIAGASAFNQAAGAATRGRLTNAGTKFDAAFPAGDENLVAEAAAHAAWRPVYAAALANLDALAAEVDGQPAISINPADPKAAENAIKTRAKTAAATSHALAPVVADALTVPLPTEPPFHPTRYYVRVTSKPRAPTLGELEERLRAQIAEAAAFTAFL